MLVDLGPLWPAGGRNDRRPLAANVPDGLAFPAVNPLDVAGAAVGVERQLTPRQVEILMALREGNSNKEIGRRLGILESTVKVQLKAIYRLLGVSNRTQAAVMAAGTGRQAAASGRAAQN